MLGSLVSTQQVYPETPTERTRGRELEQVPSPYVEMPKGWRPAGSPPAGADFCFLWGQISFEDFDLP